MRPEEPANSPPDVYLKAVAEKLIGLSPQGGTAPYSETQTISWEINPSGLLIIKVSSNIAGVPNHDDLVLAYDRTTGETQVIIQTFQVNPTAGGDLSSINLNRYLYLPFRPEPINISSTNLAVAADKIDETAVQLLRFLPNDSKKPKHIGLKTTAGLIAGIATHRLKKQLEQQLEPPIPPEDFQLEPSINILRLLCTVDSCD